MEMQNILQPWYKRPWGIFLLCLFFLVIVVGSFFLILTYSIYRNVEKGTVDYSQFSGAESQISDAVVKQIMGDSPPINVSKDDDPFLGNALNPKVVIIAFEDFQCPYCREVHPTLQAIIAKYSDQIQFVYRDFPLTEFHPESEKAAEAAECADDQQNFWEMHDIIYEHQENIFVDDLKSYARELGLDGDVFDACLDGGKYTEEVKNDLKDGVLAGASGTPTFFINGQMVAGAIPIDIFDRILQLEFQKVAGESLQNSNASGGE